MGSQQVYGKLITVDTIRILRSSRGVNLNHDDGAAVLVCQRRYAWQQVTPKSVHMIEIQRVVSPDLHQAASVQLHADAKVRAWDLSRSVSLSQQT